MQAAGRAAFSQVNKGFHGVSIDAGQAEVKLTLVLLLARSQSLKSTRMVSRLEPKVRTPKLLNWGSERSLS